MLRRTVSRNESIWRATAGPESFAPLEGDTAADVAIVGGGITGVLCAWLLRQRQLKVVLLEAHRIGEGSTGDSTGNLYALPGALQHALQDPDRAAQAWRARAAGLDLIERIATDERIDCAFARRPWMAWSPDDPDPPLFAQVRELAGALGIAVRDARDELPFSSAGAIAVDGQAQFHPLRFTRGLAARCSADACRIHEHTAVTALEPGDPCTLTTARGVVRARWVILATHTPKGTLKVHAALAPYREYGIAAPLRSGVPPPGICWTTAGEHLSVRGFRLEERDYLIAVGQPHKVGQQAGTPKCYEELTRQAAALFDIGAVSHRWSAQNYASADGLPYIGAGAQDDRVLYASGYATHGLTWAAVAAPILADQIMGRDHPLAALVKPGRFTPLASAKEIVKENVNVLGQYLKDLPGRGARRFSEVRRGQGKIVARSGEKLAVHRDDEGRLHVVSAVCTHMQCLVAWNKAERSWDCPCHGSRFTCDGHVIEGPALAALPAHDPESE